MSNASEQEQRKHKTPDGKLLRFILARKAYPSSVYSLKRFSPTLFHLHGLKTSLFPKRL